MGRRVYKKALGDCRMIEVPKWLLPIVPPPFNILAAALEFAKEDRAKEITPEVWEKWVTTWRNILIDVHNTVLSPYPVTYEDAINNAAHYLAKSSLISTVGSFMSVTKILGLAKIAFKKL